MAKLSDEIPLYICSECGKEINNPDDAHIGILTVLCNECAFVKLRENIIKRAKNQIQNKKSKQK